MAVVGSLGALAAAGVLRPNEEAPTVPRRPIAVLITGGDAARASGFAVAPDRVVTVAHALGSRQPVEVRTVAGHVRRGTVLRVDAESDLALLAVPNLPVPRATLGRAHAGDRLSVLHASGRATPAGVRRTIEAEVKQFDGSVLSRPALDLAAAIDAGDSGAPAVGDRGQVAGVIFARSEQRAETAYAVDAVRLREWLRDG